VPLNGELVGGATRHDVLHEDYVAELGHAPGNRFALSAQTETPFEWRARYGREDDLLTLPLHRPLPHERTAADKKPPVQPGLPVSEGGSDQPYGGIPVVLGDGRQARFPLIRRRVLTGLLAINPRRPTKVGFRLTYVPSVLVARLTAKPGAT